MLRFHLECQCGIQWAGQSIRKAFDTLLHHAKTEDEKTDIHSMKMLLYAATGDYERALK